MFDHDFEQMASWLTVEQETRLVLLNPNFNPALKTQQAAATMSSLGWKRKVSKNFTSNQFFQPNIEDKGQDAERQKAFTTLDNKQVPRTMNVSRRPRKSLKPVTQSSPSKPWSKPASTAKKQPMRPPIKPSQSFDRVQTRHQSRRPNV